MELIKRVRTDEDALAFFLNNDYMVGDKVCSRKLLFDGFGYTFNYKGNLKHYLSLIKSDDPYFHPDSKNQGRHLLSLDAAMEMVRVFLERKRVFGVGVNDFPGVVRINSVSIPPYRKWTGILERCYSNNFHKRRPSYTQCSVVDEWVYFSNFHQWYLENYVKGYHLDKDILNKGNKVYGPETCIFIPARLNNLLTKADARRGLYPIGVSENNSNGTFKASVYKGDHSEPLGVFDTPEEAFVAYKRAKEGYIKELAISYFKAGMIQQNVKDALLDYTVNIDD